MRIGYVGLGAMGRELAARLAPDHDLTVFDLDPAAVRRLQDAGATGAASLPDLAASCDAILLCLPKSADVDRVLFGDGGLAADMRSGTLVVDQTSGQPGLTRAFAERLVQAGVALVDAPVSGGVPLARAGTVTIMASGNRTDLGRARPILDALSCNVFECGDTVGCGQALKAINNTVNTAYRLVTLEIAAVGRRLGLDLEAMTRAFNGGVAKNFITENMLTAMLEGRPATDFAMRLMVKDIDQGFDLAATQACALPVSEASRALLCTALRICGEDARLEEVVPFMERLTGASYSGECASRADEVGLSASAATDLVTTALAACNRMIFAENLDLASLMGMERAAIAPAILSGSARSEQAAIMLAGDRAESEEEMLVALQRVCRIGARFGIPMAITNQARAQMLARRENRR